MPIIIVLYAADLYFTNLWIVFHGFACHLLLDCMPWICIPLIIGLYSRDLDATN